MNWKELKDFCNNLPESELEKNVILWREDEAITDIDASQLEEDYYNDLVNPGEGCIEKSEVDYAIKHNPDEYPKEMEHFKKVYDKGHPILSENF